MTNVQTIVWHKECYNNWKKSLDEYEKLTLQRLEKVKADRYRLNFYEEQIKCAVITKKDKFDGDTYKVKRSEVLR